MGKVGGILIGQAVAALTLGMALAPSAQAQTAQVTRVVSATGQRFTDLDTGGSGRSRLTFGQVGCGSLDARGQCVDGVWPTLRGAHWIWEARHVSPEQATRGANVRFVRRFTLPKDASGISGVLRIDADNSYVVTVNGVRVGSDGTATKHGTDFSWETVETFDQLPLRPGSNHLSVRVTNYATPGADADTNPAGLLYKLTIRYVRGAAVDQSFTSPHDLGAVINECCAFVAQTFTAGRTGSLAGVNVDIQDADAATSPSLRVAVWSVAADGTPSRPILGQTVLDADAAPLSRFVPIAGVRVVAGVRYAIVATYDDAPPQGAGRGQGIWAGATGNAYPRGRLFFSDDGGASWFSTNPGFDVHFRTYVG